VVVRPKEIHDLLNNPGKGFTTFQMFNGNNLEPNQDVLSNTNLERFQKPEKDFSNTDYPMTSIAYFRLQWNIIEPEMGKYRWDYIDNLLKLSRERGQKIILRISPYKWRAEEDVPGWYRNMVGGKSPDERKSAGFTHEKWIVDPEDPRYAQYYGGMIRALGERYDGHPDLESVDVSLVGWAGEGGGTGLLSDKAMQNLMDSYLESFEKTPLVALLSGKKSIQYAQSKANIGWRQDCLGDIGFWADEQDGWTHMYDYYPQTIIGYNMNHAWKTAPVQFEICGDFNRWKDNEGYGLEEVEYIFEQALKWHISSFNAKSAPVPDEWKPAVNEWIKKMGYRFVLRRFSFPREVAPNSLLNFTSWWENKGVAPIYHKYPLALRLRNDQNSRALLTNVDIRDWMPGDNLYNDNVLIPNDMPPGDYELELALIEPVRVVGEEAKPAVSLAIDKRTDQGWYSLGKITVKNHN